MDNLTEAQRSKCMSRIRRRDTKIELAFRRAIWHRGVKGYKVDASLPGRPDIFFPKYKLAIFIDGCFWHKCPICFSVPKSNKEYWLPKIERNVERDRINENKLDTLGITVIRYWEHELTQDFENTIDTFFRKFDEIKG